MNQFIGVYHSVDHPDDLGRSFQSREGQERCINPHVLTPTAHVLCAPTCMYRWIVAWPLPFILVFFTNKEAPNSEAQRFFRPPTWCSLLMDNWITDISYPRRKFAGCPQNVGPAPSPLRN